MKILLLLVLSILPIIFISAFAQTTSYDPQIQGTSTSYNNSTNSWMLTVNGTGFYPNTDIEINVYKYGVGIKFDSVTDNTGNFNVDVNTNLGHLESSDFTIIIEELQNYDFEEYIIFGNYPENSIEWIISPVNATEDEETVIEINGKVNLDQNKMRELDGRIFILDDVRTQQQGHPINFFNGDYIIDSDGNFNVVRFIDNPPVGEQVVVAYIDGLVRYGNYTVVPKPVPEIDFISINKLEYKFDEIVYLNGAVFEIFNNVNMLLSVSDPINNIILSNYFTINNDNTFNTQFKLDKNLFLTSGTYTIKVQYDVSFIEITFELLPAIIELTTDKEDYYENELIFINGTMINVDRTADTTITYDIYHDSQYINSGDGGTLYDNDKFNFIIDTALWNDNYNVQVDVTIQNYTSSTFFTYYDTPNTDHDVLYEYIINNNNTIAVNKESINLHELSMYEYDDYMLYNNKTLINHNNTISLQQLEIMGLQTELKVIAGFLANLNVTLSVDVPPVLLDADLAEILNENKRHQDEIDQLNAKIIDTQIKLDKAILEGNESKADKYKASIASFELSRAHTQAKLNMSNLLFLVFPQ